ncbi:uncharacterized protein LOC107817288 isoform X2 [Nicotiana tabacum]|uniref:Transcription repressor n=1 Tax=Nicotiana tabacum TaxID=4097 RepID=A0A1S4CBR1_TOBAC
MEKRFKLRICKAVSSFHSSCRSKDPSILPQDPVPNSFFRSSSLNLSTQLTVNNFPITPPPPSIPHHHQHPHRSSFKRHVSSALVTAGCRCSSGNGESYASDDSQTRSSRSQEFKWKKEEKLHVVNKIDDDTEQPHRKISYSSVSDNSDSEVLALPPPSHSITEKNKRRTQKKKNKTRFCMSTSSADESDGNFSSEIWDEEDEETETLVSSCRSLEYSTDSSSDLNQQLETIYETTKTRRQKRTIGSSKRRPVKHSKRSVSRGMNMGRRLSVSTTSSDNELPPRLSVFKKLIPCSVDGKVKESFAIVKKSEDPYEDFKRSMMEMIFEKQMFEKNDLEQLLQCFLSLNAKHYHGVIVEAFSDIWKTLFSPNHNDI